MDPQIIAPVVILLGMAACFFWLAVDALRNGNRVPHRPGMFSMERNGNLIIAIDPNKKKMR